MPYAKIVNSKVDKYPYTISDLRSDYPNDSIEEWFSDAMAFKYNVFPVHEVARPVDYTKNYEEGEPTFQVSKWVQTWVESEASESQIANRILIKWDEIRRERNNLLSRCDWTQLEDSPLTPEKKDEWASYRQYLRDITEATSPFDIEFPEEPDA
jgi:hypothetical protein